MNYRHSFHAGNFADVVKHAILARIINYLLQKPTPFRYIDTHAGVGAYDLKSEDATRTQEWENGIARIFKYNFNDKNTAFLAPYIDTVRKLNTENDLRFYPGSPEIVVQMTRPNDRLTMCELHTEDFNHLRWRYAYDNRVKATLIDGWTGLNAFIPPRERRGLVLIDPPYEKKNEFDRIFVNLKAALQKWATGIYMLWYPIKHKFDTDAHMERIKHAYAQHNLLRAELYIQSPNTSRALNGTGLFIINPPWVLAEELRILFCELAPLLQAGSGAGWNIEEINP